MPSPADSLSTAVFFDPVTRSIAKIYLDTKHLTGQIYIRLRSIIENGGGRITPYKEAASIWINGGGRITPYKEAASIWIVDPEAPNALGDPPLHITVLYAPWLIACSKEGRFLGAEQGDWCGFRVPLEEPSLHPLAYPEPESTPAPKSKSFPVRNPVHFPSEQSEPSLYPLAYPEPESTPAPKPKSFPVRNPVHFPSEQSVNRDQIVELDITKWTSTETNEAFKYPNIVPTISVWNLDLTGCPNSPHAHALDPPNSGGKRTYSDKELTWIVDTIQWCFNKYPDMTLNTVFEVLSKKGPHRTAAGYESRIRRHLKWFAGKSPLLAERLYEYADTIVINSTDVSDDENPPLAVSRAAARDQGGYTPIGRGFNTDPKSTTFTEADRVAFIRFAAARPSGMEPTGIERPIDVWVQFARMHPHHSPSSWRTWHQHWQHDLKQAVEEYRKANSW
ncbi:unnamed protein product [Rhizoctonia solani]|uniref:Uncharacterized protein n=1 Tax=Rhizoctonia solani TaxID=456999 RepID=A0A8H2X351_9AGAM|nr:unnamed protein product [Rhizoctonia solani]